MLPIYEYYLGCDQYFLSRVSFSWFQGITPCLHCSQDSRESTIFAAFLIPKIEDVARCQYCHGGNVSVDHVGAIEARLVVNSTVGESERQ